MKRFSTSRCITLFCVWFLDFIIKMGCNSSKQCIVYVNMPRDPLTATNNTQVIKNEYSLPVAIDYVMNQEVDRSHPMYLYSLYCLTRLVEEYARLMYPHVTVAIESFKEDSPKYTTVINEIYTLLNYDECCGFYSRDVNNESEALARLSIEELAFMYMLCSLSNDVTVTKTMAYNVAENYEKSKDLLVGNKSFQVYYEDTLKVVITDIERKNIFTPNIFFSDQRFRAWLKLKEKSSWEQQRKNCYCIAVPSIDQHYLAPENHGDKACIIRYLSDSTGSDVSCENETAVYRRHLSIDTSDSGQTLDNENVVYQRCLSHQPILISNLFINVDVLGSRPYKDHLYWDVETGRHLDSLMTYHKDGAFSDVVQKPTVIIFYNFSCEVETNGFIRKNKKSWPQEIFVNFFRYNYDKAQLYWYQFDQRDDIVSRYGVDVNDEVCPRMIYLDAESPVDKYETVPVGLELKLFLWFKFHRYVIFENFLNKTVNVKITHLNGNDVLGFAASPGRESHVHCHVTQILTVYDEGWNFLYGDVIKGEGKSRRLQFTKNTVRQFRASNVRNADHKVGYVNFNKWMTALSSSLTNELTSYRNWLTDMERMYSLLNTYPINLPRLTETGYHIETMSEDAYESFVTISKDILINPNILKEKRPGEPIVNARDGHVISYILTGQLENEVNLKIIQMAEKFCKTSLKVVSSALTEYHPGSYVREHIEWRDGYVIEVMVMIGDIMNNEENGDGIIWESEIINFGGKREALPLKQGQVLVFESKAIIMGRPNKIFSTEPYYVLHVHLTPTEGWPMAFMKKSFVEHESEDITDDVEEEEKIYDGRTAFEKEFGDEL